MFCVVEVADQMIVSNFYSLLNIIYHKTYTLMFALTNILSGVGNIEFRNLVLTRKAEYLAAPSRDVKGRIANEVVDAVRNRGGRFVKKLNASS